MIQKHLKRSKCISAAKFKKKHTIKLLNYNNNDMHVKIVVTFRYMNRRKISKIVQIWGKTCGMKLFNFMFCVFFVCHFVLLILHFFLSLKNRFYLIFCSQPWFRVTGSNQIVIVWKLVVQFLCFFVSCFAIQLSRRRK